MNTGNCLCNSIKYEISALPFNCCHCFCSVCRRLTGGAMGSYATIRQDDFRWVCGEEFLGKFEQNESSTRMFCTKCGSFIAGTHALASDMMFLSLGCLNNHEEVKINYQQFVASKAQWVSAQPNIPQHESWPAWVEKLLKDLGGN